MSFLVNCRHLLMGAALAPYIQHLPKRLAMPALFFMCDERWVMALADVRQQAAKYNSRPCYLSLSASLYLTWEVFTALGAALGPTIGNVERYGLDMAFTNGRLGRLDPDFIQDAYKR